MNRFVLSNDGMEKTMKNLFSDFKKFIKRGNIVDMAVGVAVAAAFTAIVTAFTNGFISPLIALFTDSSDLASLKWVIRPEVLAEDGETVLVSEVAILWGSVIQATINFLIIATVLFAVLKISACFRNRAERLSREVKNRFTDEDEKKAEAELKAKLEAEEKAKKEAEEKARIKALEEQKELEAKQRAARQEELLSEIRDLLKNK